MRNFTFQENTKTSNENLKQIFTKDMQSKDLINSLNTYHKVSFASENSTMRTDNSINNTNNLGITSFPTKIIQTFSNAMNQIKIFGNKNDL